jgi:hypothetical protein
MRGFRPLFSNNARCRPNYRLPVLNPYPSDHV